MAYLNSCTELDDLGKGKFRQVHHIKPIAYLENGVYRLASTNVTAAADGTYSHAVLAANMGVRIGDDGKYAIHPTRELARYVAFGGPQVKVGGKWTAVPFDKPTRKDNSVVWTREQADLKLTHIGHGLKHEMWLKGGYVPEDNLIAVAVNLVGLTRSGSTLLADGVPVARIQSPVVYDAANRLDTRPIKWDITSRDGQPYIVYALPDLTGMAAPVVDPTLTLQPDAAAGTDTWIHKGTPDYNYGLSVGVFAGVAGYILRGLLQFSLADLPAGATIDLATLTLYCTSESSTNNEDVGAHRALTQWYEGARNGTIPGAGTDGSTWNNRNHNGPVAWAGGAGGASGSDWTALATATTTITASGAAFDWVVTADVVAWHGGTANYGWWLINADEVNASTMKEFGSSDIGTAARRPQLVVEYTLPSTGGGMLLLGVG